MIQVKHIKKVASLFLILVTALLLVACSKTAKVPYGNISDDKYISVGDKTITEKELYDSLRKQSSTTLSKLINQELFKNYLTSANALLAKTGELNSKEEWAQKLYDELVSQAIFSSTDVDAIKKMTSETKKIAIQKFVDTQYLSNSTINRTSLLDSITNLIADENSETYAKGFYSLVDLRSTYTLQIAQSLYAREILDKEVVDEDNSNYVTEANVISYYESNEKGRQDVNVFYFHFLSLNEANAALRAHNLKTDSRGNWYEIPDIRVAAEVEDNLNIDNEYLKRTLEKVGLLDKAQQLDPNDSSLTRINEEDYKTYYDAYSTTSTRNTALSNQDVLEAFVTLHNFVNANKLATPVATENGYELAYENGNVYDGVKTYDELNTLNSSFRSYIYSSLDYNDESKKVYSTLRSVGNYRYLAFKLEAGIPTIDLVSEEKDEDDKVKWATVAELTEKYSKEELLAAFPEANSNGNVDTAKLTTILSDKVAEWKESVILAKLTSSYTSTKVSELYADDVKVEIYDLVIRTFYNQSNTTKATGSNKSGAVVSKVTATVNEEKITVEIKVDDLFNTLETTSGASAAIDLAVTELLFDQEAKRANADKVITSEKRKEYEAAFKTLISNFSNDQFASSGYPASIGREAFLILLFGSTNNDDAIKLGYELSELRTNFFEDYSSHFDNVYENLEYFSGLSFDKFKGLTVSHLLVYFDENGDGTPDDPNEHFEKIDNDEEVKAAIVQLYKDVTDELGFKSGIASGLSAIAEEFQNSARIDLNNGKAAKWEQYRKLGLNLKYESISSQITNISNFLNSSSLLDKVFYDRAIYLHDLIADEAAGDTLVDNGLPYLDFGGNSLNVIKEHDILNTGFIADKTADGKPGVMSSFGIHFILVTNVATTNSAKYEESSDRNDDYTFEVDGKTYNAYNESSDKLLKSQIEYYLLGQKQEDGIQLPSAVQTAITSYLTPVITLYTSTAMQSELLFNLLSDNNVDYGTIQLRVAAVKEINRSQFSSYLAGVDSAYDALYGEWFDKFK